MTRAPDLFVEQRVLGKSLDIVVVADGDFAQVARALIRVQHLEEIAFSALCRGPYHPTVLEPELNAFHLPPTADRRKREPDVAVRAILHGSGEYLAGGK